MLGWSLNYTFVFVRKDSFLRKSFLGGFFLGFSLARRPLQIENAFISSSVISFDLVWEYLNWMSLAGFVKYLLAYSCKSPQIFLGSLSCSSAT
jgi:hypothetical protein